MCRMLACSGYTGIEKLLLTFRQLAITGKSTDGKGHRDGWGIGWVYNGFHVYKKAECASTSELYVNTVEKVKNEHPRIFLAHLRKASPGTSVTDKEAHPFQSENLLFCHNGSIKKGNGQSLGEELDSILFFKRIQETSLKEAIMHFRDFKFTYTSLTCLLTDGSTLWAYRDFQEREDYYTLYYLKTKDSVLFCSEPIITGEWVLLRNGELVTCSISLDVRTEML